MANGRWGRSARITGGLGLYLKGASGTWIRGYWIAACMMEVCLAFFLFYFFFFFF